MSTKRYKPEQIVNLLRKIEVEIADGKTTPQAARKAGTTEQTLNPDFEILDQLTDLTDQMKICYSHQIQKVLPQASGPRGRVWVGTQLPLRPASCDGMEVAEGNEAGLAWEKMFHAEVGSEERKKLSDALQAYCKQDTLAMVSLLEALYEHTRDR